MGGPWIDVFDPPYDSWPLSVDVVVRKSFLYIRRLSCFSFAHSRPHQFRPLTKVVERHKKKEDETFCCFFKEKVVVLFRNLCFIHAAARVVYFIFKGCPSCFLWVFELVTLDLSSCRRILPSLFFVPLSPLVVYRKKSRKKHRGERTRVPPLSSLKYGCGNRVRDEDGKEQERKKRRNIKKRERERESDGKEERETPAVKRRNNAPGLW